MQGKADRHLDSHPPYVTICRVEQKRWTVADLSRYIRQMFETDYRLQDIEVEGEVSNWRAPGSGHAYFTLKDAEAQLKCVMWRSDVKLDFSGKGDFDIADPYRSQLPPDGDIKTSITLPGQVWAGVGYSPVPNLELEYNLVWINWDKFDELRINLPAGAVTVSPQDYENTISHRVGLEYTLPKQKAAIRAGFIYDPTPIPGTTLSARLPDVNRKNVTLGGSKYFGNYSAHLGLLWVTPGEKDTSDADPYAPQYKATYGVQAFVASLTLGGTFGASAKPAAGGATSTTVTRR